MEQVEVKAQLGKYGEFNVMINIAQEHSISVDDVYKMTVKQVYDLVERGKRLDYTKERLQQERKNLEPKT